jgi:hypothetical protein
LFNILYEFLESGETTRLANDAAVEAYGHHFRGVVEAFGVEGVDYEMRFALELMFHGIAGVWT